MRPTTRRRRPVRGLVAVGVLQSTKPPTAHCQEQLPTLPLALQLVTLPAHLAARLQALLPSPSLVKLLPTLPLELLMSFCLVLALSVLLMLLRLIYWHSRSSNQEHQPIAAPPSVRSPASSSTAIVQRTPALQAHSARTNASSIRTCRLQGSHRQATGPRVPDASRHGVPTPQGRLARRRRWQRCGAGVRTAATTAATPETTCRSTHRKR
mmetsp:Transcript_139143/g.444517  ORF Transcript_139143/g.444517 Transcript_139143/m.444517 type:complete len:210 (+) Transcript_139143:5507-6136(+)